MLKSSLPPALNGTRIAMPGHGVGVSAYVSALASRESVSLDSPHLATSVPLLLVHSVNASASAAEMRPLFERYGWHRPTVALELPGFGSSQRGPLPYSPQMMVQAVLHAAQYVRELGFTQPIDVLGLSLSCEFVALAALEQPTWFRSVAMVSPTGLESGNDEHYQRGRSKERPLLRRLLSCAAGEPVYRLLTTPTAMRWFLERAWGSPVIDEPLLAYEQITARHPGARHAVAAFIAGALFTEGIAERYAQISRPVWLAHGVRGEFADFGGLSRIGPPRHWSWDTFGTGAMPQLEAPRLFMARYDAFLERAAVGALLSDPAAAALQARAAVTPITATTHEAPAWVRASAAASR
jgi:pimeloyl-ACP methyl ester carboxylesterase